MSPATRTTRRRFLGSVGAGTAALLGGCAGLDDDPAYESGEVDAASNDTRTAGEMAAAEALAERDANEAADSLDALAIRNHEFVLESGYKGPTVQGVVANDGGGSLEQVEVRVRAYDDTGAQLGRYLASTGDLGPGARWRFEVILLTSVEDIAEYDVAALAVPE